MNIKVNELKQNRSLIKGVCSGVYLLFNNGDLLCVGESGNCFLRVAEHTRRGPLKFTSWSFIPKEEAQRRDLKEQLTRKYKPKYKGVLLHPVSREVGVKDWLPTIHPIFLAGFKHSFSAEICF
ncbi:MAG TPA: hypothetical protein VFG29_03080 [Syntrophales bacterium]|nr:hypothetical protein [Syntrophales bacterium]